MEFIIDHHMRLAMYALFALGLAHIDFSTPLRAQIYKTYKYFVLVFFIIWLTSELLAVPQILIDKDYSQLIDNLSVTVLYISSLLKFFTLMGTRIKELVKEVREGEQIILNGSDNVMKEIFETHRIYNRKLSILILLIGVVTVGLWFANPALNYIDWKFTSKHENVTFERILVFSSWFPGDWRNYYWPAYIYQFICGTYGASITVIPDAFLWSFMTFTTMNLDILKYKLESLPEHAKETIVANPWMNQHQAMRIVIKKCVLLHQTIIAFVTNLDNAMNFLMIVDFFICSMQIGATALRILYFGDRTFMLISAVEYLIGIIAQMMLFYWHANEILLQSQEVSMTITCSKWYTYDNDIIKDLQFIMLRSQKPLLLNIGPFFFMCNAAAISILRAAYSFIALMRQVA